MLSGPVNEPGAQLGNPSVAPQAATSSMIAALFLIETVKSELEDAGLPQAEALSKASDILAETSEKIAHVIGEADRHSE